MTPEVDPANVAHAGGLTDVWVHCRSRDGALPALLLCATGVSRPIIRASSPKAAEIEDSPSLCAAYPGSDCDLVVDVDLGGAERTQPSLWIGARSVPVFSASEVRRSKDAYGPTHAHP